MADISDKAKKPSNDKQKPIRKSTRLQERVAQQSEPLDVGVPTSMDYKVSIKIIIFNFKAIISYVDKFKFKTKMRLLKKHICHFS